MDLNENRILELKAKKNILSDEIKLKHLEIESIDKQLLNLEWVRFTWSELEVWLKANRPENDYSKNPTVSRLDGLEKTYCKLTNGGELQIGAYYYNDLFPRGRDLLVSHNFKNWR